MPVDIPTSLTPPAGAKSSSSASFIRKVKHTIGLDRAIGFTVLARGWTTTAGAVTVLLIAHFLSSAEQGYYYTFASLVALQVVFELGFSFVILQLASHERARLTISHDYVISGDPVAHARLASVIQKAVRWYSAAAVLMAVTVMPAGVWFFQTHQHGYQNVAWRLPWYLAVLAAAINFQLDPILSFIEGCGFVADVARVRLMQAIAGTVLAWAALAVHFGLFAPAMNMLGIALVSIIWLAKRRRFVLGLLKHHPGKDRIHWQSEVWPFQWRIAISWLCGYFIFQIFNPILFAFHGPVAAGQMGMSLAIVSALQAVSWSWINTKAAPFGALVANKEHKKLDEIFFRTLKQALGVHLIGAITIWLGLVYLNHVGFRFAQRVLPPAPFAVLLASASINIVVFAEAMYLRVHKQEKFLVNSILTSVFTTASAYLLGKHFGAQGMAIGYLAVVFFISLGLGTVTFQKYRRLWHEA